MNYAYPLPEKTLVNFAKKIFLPLKKGGCATVLFVAGGGKRTKIEFLLSEKTILKQIFKESFENILFVKVNPAEVLEINNLSYLNLILEKLISVMRVQEISSITTAEDNPLVAIKKNLSYLLGLDKEVVFIFDDFEFTLQLSPSIFSNLETLHSINEKKLHCLILSHVNLLDEEILMKMGHFKYIVPKNVVYVSLHEGEDRDYIIRRLEQGLSIKLPEKTKKVLIDLCGGHPRMLNYSLTYIYNYALNYLNKPKQIGINLLKNNDLKIICMDIWSQLNEKEKEILKFIAFNKTLKKEQRKEAQMLIKTGILQERDKEVIFFGQIFSQFVKTKVTPEKLTFNPESEQIFLGSKPCGNQFTNQEHRVLAYLLTNEGQVVSRDKVAQILWGKNYYDKYSDWAIDKLVSSVRKKLDSVGFSSKKLITLKKRGFCFLS